MKSHKIRTIENQGIPFDGLAENFGHAAIHEMRHEETVVGSKSEVVNAGADLRDYRLATTLQIEAQNLARISDRRGYRGRTCRVVGPFIQP